MTTARTQRRNLNRHTERGMAQLDRSVQADGWIGAITVAADGESFDGSARIEVAKDALDDAIVVRSDGRRPIVHIREDIPTADDPRAVRLGIAANRVAELNLEWDDELLASLAGEMDLSGLWDADEMAALMPELTSGDDVSSTDALYSTEQIIDAAFAYFRATGFPYRKLPTHVCMQEINKLSKTDPDSLMRTDTAYHVADTYHPHRFHASAEKMRSPFDAFNDDRLLRRAVELTLEGGRSVPAGFWDGLKIVQGTQAASNFRPGFAAYLYRRYCRPGMTVLDTSTGYGGRLVGFMASGIAGHYIGIDPNVPTHEGNLRMAADLGFTDRVELYNLPAEDVSHDAVAGRCDFAFTSPPYFAKEHYSDDDTQSWKRYSTGDEWRDGFLVPMLALQYAALKPGCTAIVNIADVKLRNKTYPLADWTRNAGMAVGFDYVRTDAFELTTRFGAGQDDEVATEPVIVFRKPT